MKSSLKLKLQKTVKIQPVKPFAFDPTFHKPDHFTSGDNHWEPDIRWQAWRWKGKPLGIKFSSKGTMDNPLVEIKIYAERLPRFALCHNKLWHRGFARNDSVEIATPRKIGARNDKVKIAASARGGLAMTPEFINSLVEEIKYLYNFDLDLAGFYKQFAKDKILGPIFKK